MPGLRQSRQPDADWDGRTENRNAGTQVTDGSGDPNRPVTKAELHEALRDHRHSTREFIGTKFAELEEMIRDGFPYGDPASHRKVHEVLIDKAEKRQAFWRNVWEKVATGGIYAALVAVGTAVWQYVKSEAHKP